MKFEALYFNSDVACEYGLAAGVILAHIAFWCKHNEDNGKNIKEGKAWTYNSVQAFKKQFPFWGEKVISNAIGKLIAAGLILKGEFNQSSYDRTSWYSLTDNALRYFESGTDTPKTVDVVHSAKKENGLCQKGKWIAPKGEMDCPKKGNGLPRKVEPIPDINTNNKPDEEQYKAGATATTAPKPSSKNNSFSFCEEAGATVIFSLPTSDGDLTFTDKDITELKSTFPDLNVMQELKQMAFKLKQTPKQRTLDHVRNYVTSWLMRSQNTRSSSAPLWQAQTTALAPEDPSNHITHPRFDREGNELDYNGNIVKTSQQLEKEKEEARLKAIYESTAYAEYLRLTGEQEQETTGGGQE